VSLRVTPTLTNLSHTKKAPLNAMLFPV